MVGSPAENKRILGLTLNNEQSVASEFRCCSVTQVARCGTTTESGDYGRNRHLHRPFSVTEALMKDGEIDVQSRNVKNAPTVVSHLVHQHVSNPVARGIRRSLAAGRGFDVALLLSEVRMPRYPAVLACLSRSL